MAHFGIENVLLVDEIIKGLTMIDKFNNHVQVGDSVYYAVGGQGNTGVYIGTVHSIRQFGPNMEQRMTEKALIISETGRKLTNYRSCRELVLVKG